ncbi:hypothetical protein QFC22_004960 [Naganishia vaughanmartiniae]|uniref:Uncharacterized protein n=1 Tax=Naganishia vaughanmartiniae TaxID=1424756 RepID=A0ACC2WXD0_9TREE|nr:hypothetical protein QFC22_004960 [Naganishia vaughanmartiniae]
MASPRASPLIPQHEFNQIRHLAQGVPLPRTRRRLKNIGLLCLGPICLIIFICYRRTDSPEASIFGTSTVESIVRKGRDGYKATTGRIPSTPSQWPKAKLRFGKDESVRKHAAEFTEDDNDEKSWKDTLVEKLFPDTEAPSIDLEQPGIEEHTYMDNGLVAVNPRGRHPIYDLLKRSQKAWKDKSARQSTTLRQAVKEYRRRYQRSPPKGFDLWWNYVQENNVQLPDEYDQINRDLEPFRGMWPAYLHSLQPEWEEMPGTYVLECNAPEKPGCHLAKTTFSEAGEERVGIERALEQLGLLKDVEEYLPHLRVTFSGHDGPAQMVGHEYRLRLVGQAFQHAGTVPVVQPLGSPDEPIGQSEVAQVGSLNDMLLDIAFVGEPIQCATQEICKELAETYEFRKRQGWDKANK